MQPFAALGVAPPRIPGGEEVVAETEPGFEHDEAVTAGPTIGQSAAAKEDMTRLRQRAAARVVDVVEVWRGARHRR